MALKLPRLQRTVALVDGKGLPTLAFHQWWDEVSRGLEGAVEGIETAQTDLTQVVSDLGDAVLAIAAAQAAATAAQAAADAAAAAGAGTAEATNLALSYPEGITITSSDNGTNADIEISDHDRIYGDGTTVSLLGDFILGVSYNTKYYLYYDDPTRAGGAVTYGATTNLTTAKQGGNRHTVGSITTTTSGGVVTTGNRLRPPGTVGL